MGTVRASACLLADHGNGGIQLEFILEILEHSLEDTWAMLPLLFAAYLVIEWFERRPGDDSPMFYAAQIPLYCGPLVTTGFKSKFCYFLAV